MQAATLSTLGLCFCKERKLSDLIRRRILSSNLIFDFVNGIKKPTDPGGAILLLK